MVIAGKVVRGLAGEQEAFGRGERSQIQGTDTTEEQGGLAGVGTGVACSGRKAGQAVPVEITTATTAESPVRIAGGPGYFEPIRSTPGCQVDIGTATGLAIDDVGPALAVDR